MNKVLKFSIAGAAVVYIGAMALAFVIGTHSAKVKAERVLDNSVESIRNTLEEGADSVIGFIGTAITRCHDRPEDITPDQLELYKRAFSVDELTTVDSRGLIVYSTEKNARPGDDFQPDSKKRLADYSQLLKGKQMVVEAFRGSVEQPNLRRKYGGVSFGARKGFVQVGLDEKRLVNDFDYFYENVAIGWRIGAYGYFILAHPGTGRIISTVEESKVGKILSDSDVAPDLLFSRNVMNRTKALSVFGMPSFVRDDFCLGHRVLTVLPEREVLDSRDQMLFGVAVILLVLLTIVVSTIFLIVKRNERVRNSLEREKLQAEKDLAMAKSIQLNALPTVFPPYPKLTETMDLYALMHTAKEVGGDFYDFYFAGVNRLAIIIADVSGKGVPAAMFMMRAKTTLQAVLRGGRDIADVVSSVNSRIAEGNEANMFVTAWVGVVDLTTGNVEYVNAGHNPPLVRRTTGEVEWIRDLSGPPLAAISDVKYRKHTFTLGLGDGLFLYTDGVTEAINPSLELFGERRLEDAIRGSSDALEFRASEDVCQDLSKRLVDFAAGAEQADDITMLAFKMRGVEKSFIPTNDGMAAALRYLQLFHADPKPAIIMDEIVSNIVRCSCATSFVLRFVHLPSGGKIIFIDDGKPFDPTAEISTPDISAPLHDRDVGGLGIFMVRKMSKSLDYARVDGHNVLTVTI